MNCMVLGSQGKCGFVCKTVFIFLQVSQKQEGDNRVLTLTQEKFNADGKSREGK